MSLAYYSRSSTKEFWEEHWRAHSIKAVARVAETSPLTNMILGGLPPRGTRVLEAGCGLGQYVMLLRLRGYRATGADWSLDALRACRAVAPGTPLSVMDLCRLGFRSGAFAAYISLGVVEHDPGGPDPILCEAWRVLQPGGVLVLSVPYVNMVRRLGAWWIRRRNRRLKETGSQFYQFAFSRTEAQAFLERNGFHVLSATPYDPARVLRGSWRSVARAFRIRGGLVRSAAQQTSGVSNGCGSPESVAARSASIRNTVRRVLYTRAGLHAFGHMILFTAVKR